MLWDICSVSEFDDDFVGLKFVGGNPRVFFPRGFQLSSDEKQLRRDILSLLATIGKFTDRREGERNTNSKDGEFLSFPILSYQYIIYDFLAHGYYIEKEPRYVESPKGIISWKRTIQKEKPEFDAGNLVYLNFVVKTSRNNDNNLISKIHEYCVYESFEKLGWLYLSTEALPQKPRIKVNRGQFLAVLRQELEATFNEEKRHLFQSMINIISLDSENRPNAFKDTFGVNRFEYIWERLIDYVFGDANREQYYPRSRWHIVRGRAGITESSELRPDTVVKVGEKVFILDSKYYRYGITFNPAHLPSTDSIQKQITYGEYVERIGLAKRENIYNAFILPFNAAGGKLYQFVAVGIAEWKEYGPKTPNYDYVLGILVDTTHLLRNYARHNTGEILRLTALIENSLFHYRE